LETFEIEKIRTMTEYEEPEFLRVQKKIRRLTRIAFLVPSVLFIGFIFLAK